MQTVQAVIHRHQAFVPVGWHDSANVFFTTRTGQLTGYFSSINQLVKKVIMRYVISRRTNEVPKTQVKASSTGHRFQNAWTPGMIFESQKRQKKSRWIVTLAERYRSMLARTQETQSNSAACLQTRKREDFPVTVQVLGSSGYVVCLPFPLATLISPLGTLPYEQHPINSPPLGHLPIQ